MKDPFHREIRYLRISLTDRCNLRCSYCTPEKSEEKHCCQDLLSLEEIEEIARAAVLLGIQKIRLTGGEPLLRQGLLSLCRHLSRLSGLQELALTTNGILLPQMADALKDAGIQRVNISLDSLDPEKYRRITRGGDLSLAIRGIRAALSTGFSSVKINTVLIGGFNTDEIAELAALTLRYPISLRFIELMPMGDPSFFSPDAYVPTSLVLEQLPQLEPLPAEDCVAKLYRFPGAPGTVGLISPLSGCFCARCDRIRLTADGFLKPCLHSPLELPLRGLHGAALRQQLEQAILQKPQRHGILSPQFPSQAARAMHQIGG